MGYELFADRDLNLNELGVSPDEMLPGTLRRNSKIKHTVAKPYATWYVLDRKRDYDENHGPKRFSLLFLGADGVHAFRHLYYKNRSHPETVAIIQPGTGCGNNWTDFREPRSDLAAAVLTNLYGKPTYLMEDNLIKDNIGPAPEGGCWPAYRKEVDHWKIPNDATKELWLWTLPT